MIRSKYRWLNGCIGVMDGTVLKIRQSVVPQIQEHWYSGHHGFHCCNNILVFAPDGTIIAADLNWPGSKHDAFCSWRIYQIIVGEFLPQLYFLIADSAFPHSGQSVNLKVVTTLKSPERAIVDSHTLPGSREREFNDEVCRMVTSCRRQWSGGIEL